MRCTCGDFASRGIEPTLKPICDDCIVSLMVSFPGQWTRDHFADLADRSQHECSWRTIEQRVERELDRQATADELAAA